MEKALIKTQCRIPSQIVCVSTPTFRVQPKTKKLHRSRRLMSNRSVGTERLKTQVESVMMAGQAEWPQVVMVMAITTGPTLDNDSY